MSPERWLYTIRLRLRSLFRRNRVEQELDAELRDHLDQQIAENTARGMMPEEARYSALRALDGLEKSKEESRDARRTRFFEDFVQDIRYGVRTLQRVPAFTIVAILTLALGISANTAVFTVVNGVLLRPMPFPEPDRLFLISVVSAVNPLAVGPSLADSHYAQFRSEDRLFEHVASFTTRTATLTGAGEPVRLSLGSVTADFFAVLRVSAAAGRTFLPDEDQPGKNHVVILGDALWHGHFNADKRIAGKPVALDGVPYMVVGVMPPGFQFPYEAQAWTPYYFHADEHNSYASPVVGRLTLDATQAQAQAELETIASHFAPPRGQRPLTAHARIIPFKELFVADARRSILIFVGAVAFVLLIACANVANLMLARATGRRQEMAVRAALGAGRGRLIRQVLTESVMVSLAGGVGGILLALWIVPALLALAPKGNLPRVEMIHIDGWVLAFTLLISLLTGIVFGLVPALGATRRELRDALNQAGRGIAGQRERLGDALVVAEVALALVLLIGAGLILKSFLLLRAVNPGFEPDNVISMSVDLPDSAYHTTQQMRAFHEQMLARLSTLPGVQAVGGISWPPLNGGFEIVGDFTLEDGRKLPDGFLADKLIISPEYFRALRIRVLHGREFNESDNAVAPGVVIISQTVAKTLWPDEDAIGKRISMEDNPKPSDWLTIVGVVDDVYQSGLRKADVATYQPYAQVTYPIFLSTMTYFVRSVSNAAQLAASMRAALHQVDKDQPAQSITAMQESVYRVTAEPRFQARLLGAFAALALLLAAVGIYGVLAYNVAQRTHEIGIRMALGAQAADVLRMILRRTMVLTGTGVVIGIAGALAVTRVLTKFLFGVTPTDPLTFVAVALTLVAAALAAGLIPARRAMRVDPMIALRHE
jgi:predicted permease